MVTREDLSDGQQAVQSTHAAIQFMFDHPEMAQEWHQMSNYLALVSVRDGPELHQLIEKLDKNNVIYSVFIEPDQDNQITAITIEPTRKGRKMVANLPLTLNKQNNANI